MDWANSMIDTLNEMAGGPVPVGAGAGCPTAGQARCLERLRATACAVGPPPDGMNGEGALSELLAKRGYGGEPATLAPLEIDLLSVPPEGHRPRGLAEVAGEAGVRIAEGLMSQILPKDEAGRKRG